MDKRIKFFKIILPIYWVFLTYMLLKPGRENQEYWFFFPGFDKIVHFSIFAFLACCLLAAFPKLKFRYFLSIVFLYAIITEILQEIMHLGRSMEFFDVVADVVGCLLGYLIYQKIIKKLMKL